MTKPPIRRPSSRARRDNDKPYSDRFGFGTADGGEVTGAWGGGGTEDGLSTLVGRECTLCPAGFQTSEHREQAL